MMFNKQKAGYAAFALFAACGLVDAADNNPKLGSETYFGSGYVEKAPEFAEVTFKFEVSCLKSAKEVYQAIEKKSSPIWKEIVGKVTTFSETDRHFWGDILGVQAQDDSYLNPRPPEKDPKTGKINPGSLKRYSTCTGKEIPLDTPVGKIYAGTQYFKVRSGDLDWVEALVRTVNGQAQGKKSTDVKACAEDLRYDVTDATKRDMRVEVQKQARLAATGPGSRFEKDASSLKFASAHFLGQRLARAPYFGVDVRMPLEKGKAPVVQVEVPFQYTIYAEAGDRIVTGAPGKVGLHSNYRAIGKHTAAADFGVTQVTLSASCIADAAKAADTIKSQSADVLSTLKAVLGSKAVSQTDQVVSAEPQIHGYRTGQPAKWSEDYDANLGQFPVLEYLDPCTGKTFPAPSKEEGKPLYYNIVQSFTLRSSDFKGLVEAVEKLREKYGSSKSQTDVVVAVSDPAADVTDATKAKLLQAAREDAAACILDTNGSLAGDASGNKFSCVHLKSLKLVSERAFNKGGGSAESADAYARSAAPMDAAPGGEPPLQVVVIKKEGDLRGRIGLPENERHYAFDFQFETQDYLPLLNSAKKPTLP